MVEDISNFDKRIAEVATEDGLIGYLRVNIQTGAWSDGRNDVGVDLAIVLPAASDEWKFTDRADPDPDDALRELTTGIIQWYGRTLRIRRWLADKEASDIHATFFA